jgi:glyoxylase-like metal-dependent hydrolase (beta-lactamase superfamily II)
MKEVTPGIFVITEKSRFKLLKPPVNIYAIPGEGGLVYDAGYGNRGCIRSLTRGLDEIAGHTGYGSAGEAFSRLLISHTHPDHFSGAGPLRKALGLKVMLTEKMIPFISSDRAYRASYEILNTGAGVRSAPARAVLVLVKRALHFFYRLIYRIQYISEPDIIIPERGFIEINGERWDVFPSPGHSDDHISLYSPSRGVLLAGDNILRAKTSWLGPPRSDLRDYIRSMREIAALPGLKLILSAHGSPVTAPAERIQQIIQWRLKRVDDVKAAVEESGLNGITLSGLYKKLYRGQGMIRFQIVEGWMRLTLKYLEDEGVIVRKDQLLPERYVVK